MKYLNVFICGVFFIAAGSAPFIILLNPVVRHYDETDNHIKDYTMDANYNKNNEERENPISTDDIIQTNEIDGTSRASKKRFLDNKEYELYLVKKKKIRRDPQNDIPSTNNGPALLRSKIGRLSLDSPLPLVVPLKSVDLSKILMAVARNDYYNSHSGGSYSSPSYSPGYHNNYNGGGYSSPSYPASPIINNMCCTGKEIGDIIGTIALVSLAAIGLLLGLAAIRSLIIAMTIMPVYSSTQLLQQNTATALASNIISILSGTALPISASASPPFFTSTSIPPILTLMNPPVVSSTARPISTTKSTKRPITTTPKTTTTTSRTTTTLKTTVTMRTTTQANNSPINVPIIMTNNNINNQNQGSFGGIAGGSATAGGGTGSGGGSSSGGGTSSGGAGITDRPINMMPIMLILLNSTMDNPMMGYGYDKYSGSMMDEFMNAMASYNYIR